MVDKFITKFDALILVGKMGYYRQSRDEGGRILFSPSEIDFNAK